MLTHHGMLAHARNVAATQNLGPDARVQVAMPLFQVGGTSYTRVAWSAGAPIRFAGRPALTLGPRTPRRAPQRAVRAGRGAHLRRRAGEPGHGQSGGLFVPGERPGRRPGAACKARAAGRARTRAHP